jgi:signal peptidase II
MNHTKKIHIILPFLIVPVLIFLDQLTKKLAVSMLAGKPSVVLINGVLELSYVENTGAAFSILEGKMIVFYIITLFIGGGIVYYMIKMPKHGKFLLLYYTFAVLLAGAVGNLIDRVVYHYVVDFIYFSLINFPVFNVADIYVTCSVFLVLILLLFYYSEDECNLVFSHKGTK